MEVASRKYFLRRGNADPVTIVPFRVFRRECTSVEEFNESLVRLNRLGGYEGVPGEYCLASPEGIIFVPYGPDRPNPWA